MPQSSSGEIRFRGVLKKPTPEMKRKMIYLKNKLPITNVQIKKLGISVTDNFKYYYETAELLLQDYQSYVINFLRRTEKTTLQYYIKDINDVWSTVTLIWRYIQISYKITKVLKLCFSYR